MNKINLIVEIILGLLTIGGTILLLRLFYQLFHKTLNSPHLFKKSESIRIGIALFPDTMPIYLAKEYGYFSSKHLNADIIKAPWNEIFDLLNDNADIIIGNKYLCSKKGTNYTYIKDIHEYRGFSLLATSKDDENRIPTFEEINKSITDPKAALKSMLSKINRDGHIKIYASDTDHLHTITNLLQELGLSIADYFVDQDGNPEQLFVKFTDMGSKSWNGSKILGKVFIGGISHRLCAKKKLHRNGIYEIFRYYEDFIDRGVTIKGDSGKDINLIHYNGFITKTENLNNDLLKKKITKVIACWDSMISEINGDVERYVTLLIKMFEAEYPYYKKRFPKINPNIIDLIWNKWEKYL